MFIYIKKEYVIFYIKNILLGKPIPSVLKNIWKTWCVLYIFSILSLAGIPLTMGFVGKFYLLNQAVLFKSWWLITGLVIGSGIGLAYYLPIIFTLFKDDKTLDNQVVDGDGVYLVTTGKQLFMFTLLISSLVFGIFPDLVSQFIYR